MNLSKWALSNSKLVNFAVLILIAGGFLAYNVSRKGVIQDADAPVRKEIRCAI